MPATTPGWFLRGKNGVVLGLVLIFAALSWTTFRMSRRLAAEPYVDYYAFYWAAQAVDSGGDIYRAGTQMYVYPPMLAAGFIPFGRLPVIPGAWLWYALSLAATFLILRAWWVHVAEKFRFPAAGWLPALGLALVVWLDQFRWEYETSQCDWLLMGGMVFAAMVLNRSPALAGLLLGFAINIKYLPLVAVVWLVARRRWAAAAATVAGVAFWALLPAVVIGWEKELEYLTRAGVGLGKLIGVRAEGQPGTIFPLEFAYSVSIPSGATRVSNLFGLGKGFAAALVALAALGVAVAARRIYRKHGLSLTVGNGPGVDVLEWAGIMTMMLAFSPQAQNRHLFMMLPVVLLGTGFLVSRVEPVKMTLALAVGFLGTGLLGSANAIDSEGEVNWGCVGGGGVAVVVMYLLILDVGLRRLSRPAE